MTKWKTMTVNCPACFEDNSFKICSHIDISENPELKDQIFDRSLFKFSCPQCGEEILVSYDCIYTDSDKNFMVALVSNQEEATTLVADGYTLRVVRSINELVEKIALMEDGIDDRVIELYKIMLEDQFEEERSGSEILGIYYGGQNSEDKSLLFYIITANAENCRATLSFETYNAITNQFSNIPKMNDNCFEINQAWAIDTLKSGFETSEK